MTGARVTTRVRSLFGVAAVVLMAVTMVLYGASTITAASAAVYPVGIGSAQADQFIDAYYRAGGWRTIGSASSPVQALSSPNAGCLQQFTTAGGAGTGLMQPACQGRVNIVGGDYWRYYAATGLARATSLYGYPTDDAHPWAGDPSTPGSGQNFAGGSEGWHILMRGNAVGAVYDLQGPYLSDYLQVDGSSRAIGYPLDDAHPWGGDPNAAGSGQNFSGGYWGWNIIMYGNSVGAAHDVRQPVLNDFLSLGSVATVGWPLDELHHWGGNPNNPILGQNFTGPWGWTIITVTPNGQAHATHGAIGAYWLATGAASGSFSYPTSEEYGWNGYIRQDYAGGSIIYGPGGARPLGPSIGSREQAALDFANAELHSPNPAWSDQLGDWWSGHCEAFVEVAYGRRGPHGGQYPTAIDDYWAQANAGRIHTDTNAPPGALVYYGGGDGHVALSEGGGVDIGTWGFVGDHFSIRTYGITALTNQYLGWAYPPDDWPGR